MRYEQWVIGINQGAQIESDILEKLIGRIRISIPVVVELLILECFRFAEHALLIHSFIITLPGIFSHHRIVLPFWSYACNDFR